MRNSYLLSLFFVLNAFVSSAQTYPYSVQDNRLVNAVLYYNIDSLRAALAAGADPNVYGYKAPGLFNKGYFFDPMLTLLNGNKKEMAELLLASGYDVNKEWKNGRRLIECFLDTMTWVLPFLIEHHADFHYTTVSTGITGGNYTAFMDRVKNEEVRKYLFNKGAGEMDPELQGFDSYADTVYITFVIKRRGKKPLSGDIGLYRALDSYVAVEEWSYINGSQTSTTVQANGEDTLIFPVYNTRKEFFEKRMWTSNMDIEMNGYKQLIALDGIRPGLNSIYIVRLRKGDVDNWNKVQVKRIEEYIPKIK